MIDVESVKIALTCQASDFVTVVLNCMAPAVIEEFYNLLNSSFKNKPLKQLTDDKFSYKIPVVNHKTLKRCKEGELIKDFILIHFNF